MSQEKTLGRGLDSLIPHKAPPSIPRRTEIQVIMPADVSDKIINLPVGQIKPNPHQPRKRFSPTDLGDLVNSIREHGILQPLVVTPVQDGYELVAGERRLRAAKILGLKGVPVIVRETKDSEQLELSLIENIQRQDLNPIERAEAYQKLIKGFGLSHGEAAKRLGKPLSVVSNTIRLLALPLDIQRALIEGRINEGHAKVIVGVTMPGKQREIFNQIINERLTVRDVEAEVAKITVKRYVRKKPDLYLKEKEETLSQVLGTKVKIRKTGRGGQLIIDFYSQEELEGLVRKIRG